MTPEDEIRWLRQRVSELEHSVAFHRRLSDTLFGVLLDSGARWDKKLDQFYAEGWMRQGQTRAQIRVL